MLSDNQIQDLKKQRDAGAVLASEHLNLLEGISVQIAYAADKRIPYSASAKDRLLILACAIAHMSRGYGDELDAYIRAFKLKCDARAAVFEAEHAQVEAVDASIRARQEREGIAASRSS